MKERYDILKEVDRRAGQHGARSAIALQFGIPNSTLSTIIKDREEICSAFEKSAFEPARKHLRKAEFDDVEDGLLIWFMGVRGKDVPISGLILQAKAKEIATGLGHEDFSCSNG